MVNHADRWPEFPYLDRPGCCPRCGAGLRPEPDRVVLGGSWSKDDGKGGIMTGGQLVSYQCPQCRTRLLSGTEGWPKWYDIDHCQLRWFAEPAGPD